MARARERGGRRATPLKREGRPRHEGDFLKPKHSIGALFSPLWRVAQSGSASRAHRLGEDAISRLTATPATRAAARKRGLQIVEQPETAEVLSETARRLPMTAAFTGTCCRSISASDGPGHSVSRRSRWRSEPAKLSPTSWSSLAGKLSSTICAAS